MMISGDNFQCGHKTEYSYYFSKYSHVWGWASWRRAWQYYDVNMKTWPEYKKRNFISTSCEDLYEQKYWIDIFERVFDGDVDTWDYQWLYACWQQNGLSIQPNSNLVSNIGFGLDGTHTHVESPYAQLSTEDIWDIKHPLFTVRHRDADAYTFDYVFDGKYMKQSSELMANLQKPLSVIKSQLKSWKNKFSTI